MPKAIVVKDLHKTFRLPHERHSSLKQAALNWRRRLFEQQKVLDGISFDIEDGDFFGIVGKNGSGKSTLLKILADIYTPTSGSVEVNGLLTPFIELGVGFNPELTGRDNVYLNGAIFGLSRKEVDNLYDEIVGFAELEKFMDQKLKNYSSGMQVRLAFSIAIRAKTDILLLDEVLAVGDEAFQKKCIAVFEKYKAKKQTIVLVTHDMNMVERFCSRALLLDDGEIVLQGSPQKVAQMYSLMNTDRYLSSKRKSGAKQPAPAGVKIQLVNTSGKPVDRFKNGDKALLQIQWQNKDVKNVGIALVKQSGEYIFGSNTILDKIKLKGRAVGYEIDLNIGAGDYEFKLGFFGDKEKDVVEFADGPEFFMESSKDQRWGGLTKLGHSWKS